MPKGSVVDSAAALSSRSLCADSGIETFLYAPFGIVATCIFAAVFVFFATCNDKAWTSFLRFCNVVSICSYRLCCILSSSDASLSKTAANRALGCVAVLQHGVYCNDGPDAVHQAERASQWCGDRYACAREYVP